MGESFEFKAEIQQLLNILVHSLYTERETFLRELLSNASDALHRLQFEMLTNENVRDPEAELAVHITVDKDARTIIVHDTGIGMTRDELITNLGTIAQSGAAAFLEAMQENASAATDIIGQFGVGFYSVFMVAAEVQVTSRSFQPEASAARWICDGSDRFTVEDAEMDRRGTAILVRLKEDAAEFADEWRLRQIIKRHSDFVPFPIYLGEPEEGQTPTPVNQQTAIWRQAPRDVDDEAYENFYKQITFDFEQPLAHVHISSEAPLDLHAILYVPSKHDRGIFAPKEHGLRLYSKKILIREHYPDLLPEYLRFVEGVVDSEDLPLNVSRESIQVNPFLRKIRSNLVRRLTGTLVDLAKEDPDRYRRVWEEFGPYFKEGTAMTPEDRGQLVKLLRFRSSRTGSDDWVSFADYVARMPEAQEAIYYLFGEDLSSITHSPHLDPFKASDAEVLYLTEVVDPFVMDALREFDGHPLKNIADADVEVPKVEGEAPAGEALPDDLFNPLLKRCNEVLGERVVVVRESSHLTESPARLVAPDDAPHQGMERVRRLVERDFEASRRVMEINRRHPLIRDLAQALKRDAMDALVPQVIEQLFENALLVEGIHPNPAEMVGRIQDIMAAAAQARAGE